jgi:hypothetical protein
MAPGQERAPQPTRCVRCVLVRARCVTGRQRLASAGQGLLRILDVDVE